MWTEETPQSLCLALEFIFKKIIFLKASTGSLEVKADRHKQKNKAPSWSDHPLADSRWTVPFQHRITAYTEQKIIIFMQDIKHDD